MNVRKFILSAAILLAICPFVAAQQFSPPGQPYVPSTPGTLQPIPQGVPVYPPGSTVVPLPSQTPGSIFGPPANGAAPIVTTPQPAVGVEQLPAPPVVVGPGMPGPPPVAVGDPPNPILVPVVDDEFAWDQIADVVSDYFKISREQRARRGNEGWCEGRIETAPRDGATWLEPWRHDSVGSFNRWESTFQSIRRHATVRVVPDANGYLVEVIVEKELEDLPKPEKATAGAATFTSSMNLTLPSNRMDEVSRMRASTRWLPMGRDPALEQRMLMEIHARLNGVTSGRSSLFAQ